MKETVDQILTIWAANAGGFVLMAMLVLVLGYLLYRMVRQHISTCERDREDCQKHSRELALALIDMAAGNGDEAYQRAQTVLSTTRDRAD